MLSRPGYPSHYATTRPWDHLTPSEFAVLRPFFEARPGQRGPGRPIFDLRARLDAIFWVACHNGPWRNLPPEMGPADTASRQFRRWAHAGVWTRLLEAMAHPDCPLMLRRMHHWVCRCYRRALRILKLPGLVLAQRLGQLSALPGPWWLLPKPDLSKKWLPVMLHLFIRALEEPKKRLRTTLRELKWMHRFIGGRVSIPKHLAPP